LESKKIQIAGGIHIAVETALSIFCSCRGTWRVKSNDDGKIFICPMCGTHKPIPEDTSMFQIKLQRGKSK
ncbi:MAG: hypothetical protein ACFFDT_27220, partial [Candidatus Hodarchaeota archaeon]